MLDQRAFQEGYAHGRQYYFDDAWEEQIKEGVKEALTSSHLLGLIAVRDERDCYQLDDGCDESTFRNGVEELLGVVVGYLSGPLHPETHYEDLKIANLVKNHHLAKSISDAAWGRFLSWVRYYSVIADVPVVAVAPHFTSQQCSGCGKMVKKSPSQRTHRCVHCGLVMDRDENAARNILYKALQWLKTQGCTVGHTETGTPARVRKASGQKTTTASQQ